MTNRRPKRPLLEKVEIVKDDEDGASVGEVKVYIDNNGINKNNGAVNSSTKSHYYTKVSYIATLSD